MSLCVWKRERACGDRIYLPITAPCVERRDKLERNVNGGE